jgi:hypothetical protein
MSYICNKQANVREAEVVIAYLEKELGNTEEDMARIQQEVCTCLHVSHACVCVSVCVAVGRCVRCVSISVSLWAWAWAWLCKAGATTSDDFSIKAMVGDNCFVREIQTSVCTQLFTFLKAEGLKDRRMITFECRSGCWSKV